jgi:hypothetical protein
MNLTKYYDFLIILPAAVLLKLFVDINNYVSFLLVLIFFAFVKYFLRMKNKKSDSYDSELFNLIEQGKTEEFIKYVEKKYPSMKSLEKIVSYV